MSFVHNQARELAAMGHRVRVLLLTGFGKCDLAGRRMGPVLQVSKEDGVEICRLRYITLSRFGEKLGFNVKSARAAISLWGGPVFRDFQPDVIHAHNLGFSSQTGAWLKKRLRCPLVVTTHGSDVSIPFERGEREMLKRWSDQADYVGCGSSALAARLEACGTNTPLTVILNGFQTSYLPRSDEKKPLTFVQVGHLLAQKRFYITIRAFAEIHRRHPEAELTLIGQGPDRERLERLCRDLGVEDSVTFTGQIHNQEVLRYMGQSQFFVMPSVREGFGIVYLEAMAAGCITIGTQGEGIADLIVDGKNGFLVPADTPEAIVEVVERCLARPELMSAVTAAGRKDAGELTWRRSAERYTALFEKLTRKETGEKR